MKSKTVTVNGECLVIEYKDVQMGDTIYNLNSNTKYEASEWDCDEAKWVVTGKGEPQNARIEVLLSEDKIHGNQSGNNLYLVTFIEYDDPEDTFTEIWRASDEEDLYDQIKTELSEDADDPISFEDEFEGDWGGAIQCKLIGEVN
jgi:hypothetical protein